MSINQAINALKRRAESVCAILFYVAAAFCFICYVGSFNGSFMPVMGTLLSMIIEVSLWLLIPVLLSIRRRSVAKWAFLGLSIFWVLTSIFSLLDGAGLATAGADGLACAVGVFSFLVACALITTTVLAVIAYWKKDQKLKIVSILVFLGSLVFFLVLFALRVALAADWDAGWATYFFLIYSYLLIPFAMLFAALAFWFSEKELYFAVFEKKAASEAKPAEEKPEEKPVEKTEAKPAKKASAKKNAERAPAEEPVAEEAAPAEEAQEEKKED
ncbi:MAG: hypothetical protein J5774_02940 [Clostridia bacterium]|nr:hypothetical protein [Clostridia bacterium]